ncbi:hypothetical protein CDAR_196051 [Caerostris darwini]|uniref:Uncharacterized protein n=1 Tax=Caerostris darwini TaxID=1538125 RepID=A0AAV4MJ17_9ARAC|nr:hypothetical protein CDAR_196051 [Caerostris darwini]
MGFFFFKLAAAVASIDDQLQIDFSNGPIQIRYAGEKNAFPGEILLCVWIDAHFSLTVSHGKGGIFHDRVKKKLLFEIVARNIFVINMFRDDYVTENDNNADECCKCPKK